MSEYIFRSNGTYFGFISNGNLFSRDGEYVGWIEGKFVWDSAGNFRGEITELNNTKYILRNIYLIPPIPKIPKVQSAAPIPPLPPTNVVPTTIPMGFKDAF